MTDKNPKAHPPPILLNDDRPRHALTIDYAFYEQMLEESDASYEEKRAFIEIWWNLVVNFVDLGFEVHPLQQACEQDLDLSTLGVTDVLDSKELPINFEFNRKTLNNKGDV